MIEVFGKEVYTELAELVDPAHTALVLVDMQRDFLERDGFFGGLGIDLTMYDRTRPRLAGLLAAARQQGLLVVHVQNTALADGRSDSPAQLRFYLRLHAAARDDGPPLRYTVPGTPGHDFVEEFVPKAGELTVRKYRSSGFWGTNLDLVLESNGIKTVVVAGCTTEGCVESTARDALFCNYYVVIAADCVGSDDQEQHDASMLLMRHRFDLADSSDLIATWDEASSASAGE
ncbi:MAG: biuret amidohydrolase [Frankiales bacterium]|nr:hypothetical protein [Frankiales bacterium]MDX6219293.1 biuret amidohydrolase [Frankiales bacterium]